MSIAQQSSDTATSVAVKATPPLAVIGATLAGISVDDWIKWVTLAYVCLLLLHKLWHMALEWHAFWIKKERHHAD